MEKLVSNDGFGSFVVEMRKLEEVQLEADEQAKAILKQFYKDLQAWINAGFPVHRSFKIERAVCSQLIAYTKDAGHYGYIRDVTCEELKREFREAGLDTIYPFNPVAENEHDLGKSFDEEFACETFYFNEARLNWINEHSK